MCFPKRTRLIHKKDKTISNIVDRFMGITLLLHVHVLYYATYTVGIRNNGCLTRMCIESNRQKKASFDSQALSHLVKRFCI